MYLLLIKRSLFINTQKQGVYEYKSTWWGCSWQLGWVTRVLWLQIARSRWKDYNYVSTRFVFNLDLMHFRAIIMFLPPEAKNFILKSSILNDCFVKIKHFQRVLQLEIPKFSPAALKKNLWDPFTENHPFTLVFKSTACGTHCYVKRKVMCWRPKHAR